jgi:hypothetical protein
LDSNKLYGIGFDGAVTHGPVDLATPDGAEGVVELPDGTVLTADYFGRGSAFDQQLLRAPERDESWEYPAGVRRSRGLAWNPMTSEFLTIGPIGWNSNLIAVNEDLTESRVVGDLGSQGVRGTNGLTFLADEDRVVAAEYRRQRLGFLSFVNVETGVVEERLQSEAISRPYGVTYLEDSGDIVYSNLWGEYTLRTMSFDGTLNDLPISTRSPLFLAETRHALGLGPGYIFSEFDSVDLVFTDDNGLEIDRFDYQAELGLLSVSGLTYVSSGENEGSIAALTMDSSEIVFFKLLPLGPPDGSFTPIRGGGKPVTEIICRRC